MVWPTATPSNTTSHGAASYDWSRPTWQHKPAARQDEDPLLVGDGPPECSSCTALVVAPAYVHDVNGYYRELGVFPWATKGQLRRAYHGAVTQFQSGPRAARLTYILSQLLDSETRAVYDAMPPGSTFVDRYVEEALKRKMKTEMSSRRQTLHDLGVDTDLLDWDSIERDIWSQLGVEDFEDDDPETDPDTPSEVVDSATSVGEDGPSPAKFEYAYYIWATRDSRSADTRRRLVGWQALLVSALAREGVILTFAVGVHGKPHRWVVAKIGYRTTFLLGVDVEPDPDLAVGAVMQYLRDQQYRHKPRTHREIEL